MDADAREAELSALRQRVDEVNQRLLGVLAERARLVREIARHKRCLGRPIHDPLREESELSAMQRLAPAELDADAVRNIFRAILEESRRQQR